MTEDEKKRMIQTHEENMNAISGIMDADKKRQEQELDRILKDRLERRRNLKERQHKKEI
jgi:hypothetical protein